ncbi:MAG TPA: hypothetical protein VFI14_02320 [Chryseosolibacter sp.]|jgi:hypothetical protein|nr:hypothetical protein [Chryseosolibacter sp.]
MRHPFVIFSLIFFPSLALSQGTDSTRASEITGSVDALEIKAGDLPPGASVFGRDNIVYVARQPLLTAIENEILNIEAREVRALLARDTLALRLIWQRDFTLDERSNELVTGKNPLPYYILLKRFLKNITPSGAMVFTSGFEVVQELKANGKVGDRIKRPYFHTWTNEFGVWKLATNRHD